MELLQKQASNRRLYLIERQYVSLLFLSLTFSPFFQRGTYQNDSTSSPSTRTNRSVTQGKTIRNYSLSLLQNFSSSSALVEPTNRIVQQDSPIRARNLETTERKTKSTRDQIQRRIQEISTEQS